MKIIPRAGEKDPVAEAIERGRKAIAVTTEDQARQAQLSVDRQNAVESGDVDKLVRIDAELEILVHKAKKNEMKAWDLLDQIFIARADVKASQAEELRESRAADLQKLKRSVNELALYMDVEESKIMFALRSVPHVDGLNVWERNVGFEQIDWATATPRTCHPSVVSTQHFVVPRFDVYSREIDGLEGEEKELRERKVDRAGDLTETLESMAPAPATTEAAA